MANDKEGYREIQKVKVVGPLATTALVLSIIRDVLLILFLIVAVVGIVFVVTSLSSALSGVGGLEGLGGLLGLLGGSGAEGGGAAYGGAGGWEAGGQGSGGADALLQGFLQDIESNNWESAEVKVNQFELLVQQEGSADGVYLVSQLKQAVKQHNKQKVYEILAQAKDKEEGR